MATGLIAWTCLLLATPPSDEVYYMKNREFLIPITIRPEARPDLKELILYMSKDEGRTWEVHNVAKPDAKGFDFTAPGDGLYYFTIASVDRSDRRDPPDPYKAKVGQRVYIDTTRPNVRITEAVRVADEIQISWEARDERPESASLKLEWRMAAGGQWTPLPIQSGERGNYKLRPGVPGDVALKLSMRDLAGNEGVDEKQVAALPSPQMTTSVDRGADNSGLIRTSVQDSGPAPLPGPVAVQQPLLATRSSMEPVPGMSPAPYSPTPTRGPLPPLKIVNKRSLKLGFDVSKVGPSGLGSVDVYVTTDEGATWEKSITDPGVTLPVSAEARGLGPQKGTVTVQLPKDGIIYGFHLVVRSRAGLGKSGPKSGDAPLVRIEVDTTQPEARLFQPQPDVSRPNALLLTWEAADRNLAQNPISLEYSEIGREWHSIGDSMLPNTGRFTWVVPANMPPKVHLRLTVRDTAGNVAVAATNEPVLIDTLTPEVGDVSIIGP